MKNSQIALLTILIILGIISFGTVLKVEKNHQEREKLVSEKKIIEAYITCERFDKCHNKATLEQLINDGYLDKEINPETKTYYNLNSYVINDNGVYKFIII